MLFFFLFLPLKNSSVATGSVTWPEATHDWSLSHGIEPGDQ
jgi:hypothetical protein